MATEQSTDAHHFTQGMTRLDRYTSGDYRPGASKLRIVCWLIVNAVFLKNAVNLSSGLKVWLLRRFGASIGRGVVIKQSVSVKYPWRLTIGDHVWIGEHVWIDNLGDVHIGSHSCLSQGAFILTGNHDYKSPQFSLLVKPVILEEGVWVGARAVICPGVRCRSHAVLTVGSVATSDLEAFQIYQGNPAKPIRTRQVTGADQ